MRLKTKLLLRIILPVVVGVIGSSLYATQTLTLGSFPSWVSTTKQTMVTNEELNIQSMSRAKAKFTTETLEAVELDLTLIRKWVLESFTSNVTSSQVRPTVGLAAVGNKLQYGGRETDRADASYFFSSRWTKTDDAGISHKGREYLNASANALAALISYQKSSYNSIYISAADSSWEDNDASSALFYVWPAENMDYYSTWGGYCDSRSAYSKKPSIRNYDWDYVKTTYPTLTQKFLGHGEHTPLSVFDRVQNREEYRASTPRSRESSDGNGREYYKQGYDPRCRLWYQNALEAGKRAILNEDKSGNEAMIFTPPYVFSTTGNLGMTAAAPFFKNPYDASSFIGVIGLDFTIAEIDKTVNKEVNGMPDLYGFMTAYNGLVASHRSLKKEEGDIHITEIESSADSTFAEATRQMSRGCTSTTTYNKGGDVWYLSYAPENVTWERPLCEGELMQQSYRPSTSEYQKKTLWYLPGSRADLRTQGYAIGITVSKKSILSAFQKVEADINSAVGVFFSQLITLIVVIGVAVFCLAGIIADGVAVPISKLLKVCRKLNAHDYTILSSSLEGAGTSPELKVLVQVFEQMATVVRFANVSLDEGKLDVALRSYEDALKLFTALGNEKGIGVCNNNLGNAFMLKASEDEANSQDASQNYQQALQFFDQACAHAQQQLDESTLCTVVAINDNSDDKSYSQMLHPEASSISATSLAHVKQLANREHNKGMLMMTQSMRAVEKHFNQYDNAKDSNDSEANHLFAGNVNGLNLQLQNAVLQMQRVLQLESLHQQAGGAAVTHNIPRAISIFVELSALHMYASQVLAHQNQRPAAEAQFGFGRSALDQATLLLSGYQQGVNENSNVPKSVLGQRIDKAWGELMWPALGQKVAKINPESMQQAINKFKKCVHSGPQADLYCLYETAKAVNLRCSNQLRESNSPDITKMIQEWKQWASVQEQVMYGRLCKSKLRPKQVSFLMDVSGSMAGSRINAASTNMLKVYDEYVHELDSVGFTAFNHSVQSIVKLGPVGPRGRQNLRQQMASACKTGGGTAFYDAIVCAVQEIHKFESGASTGKFVVALTDGEDAHSKTRLADAIQAIHKAPGVTLIVIGLSMGENIASLIEQLTSASKNGVYIDAEDNSALASAFKQVATLISGPNLNVESY